MQRFIRLGSRPANITQFKLPPETQPRPRHMRYNNTVYKNVTVVSVAYGCENSTGRLYSRDTYSNNDRVGRPICANRLVLPPPHISI